MSSFQELWRKYQSDVLGKSGNDVRDTVPYHKATEESFDEWLQSLESYLQ